MRLLILAIILLLPACSRPQGPPPLKPEVLDQAYTTALKKWDIDKDGTADCHDLGLWRTGIFNGLDINRDDFLDQDEFASAAWADVTFQIVQFDVVDRSGDNLISRPEFARVNNSDFGRLDDNGNCTIERAELENWVREKMRADRRAGVGRKDKKPKSDRPRF